MLSSLYDRVLLALRKLERQGVTKILDHHLAL